MGCPYYLPIYFTWNTDLRNMILKICGSKFTNFSGCKNWTYLHIYKQLPTVEAQTDIQWLQQNLKFFNLCMVTRIHTNLLETQLSWRLIFYCGLRKYFEHLDEQYHGNKWKEEIFLRTNFWGSVFFEKNKFPGLSIHWIWGLVKEVYSSSL